MALPSLEKKAKPPRPASGLLREEEKEEGEEEEEEEEEEDVVVRFRLPDHVVNMLAGFFRRCLA